MGVWGTGVFGNGGAGDFVAELDHAEPTRRPAVMPSRTRNHSPKECRCGGGPPPGY